MTSRKYDVEEHSAPNSMLYKFVEQYDKLQYIRDEEENYQEKQAKMVSYTLPPVLLFVCC
jgi:hypothetical protein